MRSSRSCSCSCALGPLRLDLDCGLFFRRYLGCLERDLEDARGKEGDRDEDGWEREMKENERVVKAMINCIVFA